MIYKTLATYQNQYRTMRTDFIQFQDYDIERLAIESCVKQNGTGKTKVLGIHFFESLTFVNESSLGFLHCLGFDGKKLYMVVLRNGN